MAAATCMPMAASRPAVAVIHDTKGAAAAAIAIDAGPSQVAVRSVITALNPDAVAYNSSARTSQADAAAKNGPGPAPVYINPELTSGGNAAKSSIYGRRKINRSRSALRTAWTRTTCVLLTNVDRPAKRPQRHPGAAITVNTVQTDNSNLGQYTYFWHDGKLLHVLVVFR